MKAYVKNGMDFFTYGGEKDFLKLKAWLVSKNKDSNWSYELNFFVGWNDTAQIPTEIIKFKCEGANYEIHPRYSVILKEDGFEVMEPYYFNQDYEVR